MWAWIVRKLGKNQSSPIKKLIRRKTTLENAEERTAALKELATHKEELANLKAFEALIAKAAQEEAEVTKVAAAETECEELTLQQLKTALKEKERQLELLNDPETIFMFGQLSYDGDGVEQDYCAAASWFKIAAEAGHLGAQHNLSLMYESGLGVPRDDEEALRLCKAAAELGHAGSQNNLGARFESGEGVTKSVSEAIEWYRRAAESEDANACDNLRRILAAHEVSESDAAFDVALAGLIQEVAHEEAEESKVAAAEAERDAIETELNALQARWNAELAADRANRRTSDDTIS